jgi:hypothetical protein
LAAYLDHATPHLAPAPFRLLAGGAAAGGLGAAPAQERLAFPAEVVLTPRIDRFDPALDNIISISEPIREIASGFGGPLGPAEGPLWWKEGGYLLFSDINAPAGG